MQRILIVDDEANVRKALTTMLRKAGYDTREAANGEEALTMLADYKPQAVLLDLRMPGLDGMETLRRLREHGGEPLPSVIMMTAYGMASDVMEAMKLGAFDYVQKPFDLMEVKQVVAKAVAMQQTARERDEWQEVSQQGYRLGELVGLSPKMQEVYKLVGKVSMSKSTVLIEGESGTGKELIAKAIHSNSPRADHPLITVNCGAIPENLLESELFGYERGAFTGAITRKIGLFELADGGTIFLDEIGEMPLQLQVKLLRVLQERVITRLGGGEPIPVDVRVIAATNRSLPELIKRNQFREDLYYRLNVVPIRVPPLRERKEDIPLLIRHFLAKYQQELGKTVTHLSKQAVDLLLNHDWPGNVRQLEHVIERAVVLAGGAVILPEHIMPALYPDEPGDTAGSADAADPYEGKTLREILQQVERDVIARTLRKTNGNKLRTAKILGMSRRALLYKIEAYNLQQNVQEGNNTD
jgi:DNA-binding NtrC family response regulator